MTILHGISPQPERRYGDQVARSRGGAILVMFTQAIVESFELFRNSPTEISRSKVPDRHRPITGNDNPIAVRAGMPEM
jgi:hypothetical protein